jgi:hypothetical protein
MGPTTTDRAPRGPEHRAILHGDTIGSQTSNGEAMPRWPSEQQPALAAGRLPSTPRALGVYPGVGFRGFPLGATAAAAAAAVSRVLGFWLVCLVGSARPNNHACLRPTKLLITPQKPRQRHRPIGLPNDNKMLGSQQRKKKGSTRKAIQEQK